MTKNKAWVGDDLLFLGDGELIHRRGAILAALEDLAQADSHQLADPVDPLQ